MSDVAVLSSWIDTVELPEQVDHDWLVDHVLTPIGIDASSELAAVVEETFLHQAFGDSTDPFEIRAGGWRLNTAATTVKAFIVAALVGSALFIDGAPDIPAELIPAVLPFVIDVERVRLNRRDKELLIPVQRAANGIEGIAVNPRLLYGRLDPAVQAEIEYESFSNFCERLIDAGLMDDPGYGDVRPRPAAEPAWIRVTFT